MKLGLVKIAMTLTCKPDPLFLFLHNSRRMGQLIARYEAPNSANRWDSPLFTVGPEDEIDEIYVQAIYDFLQHSRPLTPHLSTMAVSFYEPNH
jgi:Chromatin associated protein KTI12